MRVGIERASLHVEGVGDLADVFAAWCAGSAGRGTAATDFLGMMQTAIAPCLAGMASADRAALGLLLASTKGQIVEQVRSMREGRPDAPTLASTARELAARCGMGGPVWVVSTACSSGIAGLIDAVIALRAGEFQRLLVTAGDLAESFVRDGFAALKAHSPTGVCRPFDRARDGLMLGSAAAACIVAPLGPASLCEILGFGVSNDAVHMTAPDREGRGLARAMEGALAMARLAPQDVEVVIAHGTATRYNDAMEAVAIEKVFLAQGARPLITAVKGVIGHSLGGSGLVEALLGSEILRRGHVPGVVGLREPERSDVGLLCRTKAVRVRRLMKVASGFGGVNAAIILGATSWESRDD